MGTTDLILTTDSGVSHSSAMLVPDTAALKARVAAIEAIITDLFVEGVHYGEPFPGSDKKSLLQPGAELVASAFGLSPEPAITWEKEGSGHRSYMCEGPLLSDGGSVGRMSAECTTLESKYRWRKGRICPECGKAGSIIKGKTEYGGGWLCFAKKDGCGAKFKDGDAAIEEQPTTRVENEDPADYYHTCRMMCQKRWLVAITRRTFGLSARFVDAEGYRNAKFNWEGKGGDLLRALPGERKALWARVGNYTLAEFGKEPREITNVEGAVVMDWLREQAGNAVAADTDVPDTSPVQPPPKASRKPPKGKKADPRGQLDNDLGAAPTLLDQELAAPDEVADQPPEYDDRPQWIPLSKAAVQKIRERLKWLPRSKALMESKVAELVGHAGLTLEELPQKSLDQCLALLPKTDPEGKP